MKDLKASGGVTHCNEFLPKFLDGLGGHVKSDIMPSGEGADLSAKGLGNYFASNPKLQCLNKGLTQADAATLAQNYANEGYLVLAASDSVDRYSAHVSVVVPQNTVYNCEPSVEGYTGTSGNDTHQGRSVLESTRDYPVFLQAGTYTGTVPPGYAFSRKMYNEDTVKYYLYKPEGIEGQQ